MIWLSVLIPSLPDQNHLLQRVKSYLGEYDGVEILDDTRDRHIPTGTKRNDLIARASGQYVSFVDDDDWVHPDYCKYLVSNIISYQPDCVTFEGWMTTNGLHRVDWEIRLGEKYEERGGKYYRWPNHLCAIKKRIAQSVKFHAKWQLEDYEWSKEIKDRGLLKTSLHIPVQLYHYDFWSPKNKIKQ